LSPTFLVALLAATPLDAGTIPAPQAAGDAPTVTARTEKAEAHVGDAIPFTITSIGPRAMPVVLPANLDLGPFSELSRTLEEKDLGDGKMSRAFNLKIAAYEPGDVEIPSVELTYFGQDGTVKSVQTQPIPITISSLIANEPEPKLKDNAASMPVVQRDYLLLYIAGGLTAAGLGAAIALWVRRRLRNRKPARPPDPPRPAHEVAMEKLDRLGTLLGEGGDLRPFYFQLSEAIREYLGGRFGFDSLEMTTEELVAAMRRVPLESSRGVVSSEIEGWLSSCDLVKFAKVSPSPEQARGSLETAIRMVEATRPRAEQGPPLSPPHPNPLSGKAGERGDLSAVKPRGGTPDV
jgi:hypothetical protein